MTTYQDIIDDIDQVVLDEDDFAIPAVLRCRGYAARSVKVIFTEAASGANPLTGEVETTAPDAIGKESDFAKVSHGDEIEPSGKGRFAIVGGPEPDGFGMARIILSRSDV